MYSISLVPVLSGNKAVSHQDLEYGSLTLVHNTFMVYINFVVENRNFLYLDLCNYQDFLFRAH